MNYSKFPAELFPAKIGLVTLNGKDVCLIDSGNDKDAGRKVRQLLDANGWRLTAVYRTHSNADHIGGNKYLQGQIGCKIYAPGIDCDFTRHPILEPYFLYGVTLVRSCGTNSSWPRRATPKS